MALADYDPPADLPEFDPAFTAKLIESFNSQERMPVALLFNEWWQHASDHAREEYRQAVRAAPGFLQLYEETYFAPPLDIDALMALPVGTLGRTFGHFITDNGLAPQIAMDYRARHEQLKGSGMLDRMPDELQYAVLRGFQVHDWMHVLTGYEPKKTGEQAVLAFCLGQMTFPYFAIWMSVTTTRMAFVDPTMTQPLMDAISDGWRAGREAKNVQWIKLEEMVAEPLAAVRARYGIVTANTERLAA